MKNNLLSEKLVYTGESVSPTHLQLCSYNTTELQEAEGKTFDDVSQTIDSNRTNWLKVCGMKDTEVIRSVCEHFEIDFLILQDILNANHPTKIEEHNSYLVVIMKLFQFEEDNQQSEMKQQQLCLILGPNYVLSFLEYSSPFFDDISSAIHSNVLHIRRKQSDYLFSVLLNSVMANYTHIVTSIDDNLENLEEALLKIISGGDIGIQIQSFRRQYLQIKKAVLPLKEQYTRFLRLDSPLIQKANYAFFNDVNDHLQFVLQTIEICRETLSSLVDLYISNTSLKMNDIMKRLTVVSTIFIPLTFLVGVWGMNFNFMPELSWENGYLYAWLLMVIIGLAIYLFFKRKKWY